MPILDSSRHVNIVKGCHHSLVKITKKNPITNLSCNGEPYHCLLNLGFWVSRIWLNTEQLFPWRGRMKASKKSSKRVTHPLRQSPSSCQKWRGEENRNSGNRSNTWGIQETAPWPVCSVWTGPGKVPETRPRSTPCRRVQEHLNRNRCWRLFCSLAWFPTGPRGCLWRVGWF